MKLKAIAILIGAGVLCLRASAQSYSINWYKIAGGGGTSTNGPFALSGTIGQPDAGAAMSGGSFSVTGGFWSVQAVPQPGLPNLLIAPNGPHSVKVLWPDANTNTYTLQQTSNLSAGVWTASNFTITSANGTNSIIVTAPAGNLFFRLKQ